MSTVDLWLMFGFIIGSVIFHTVLSLINAKLGPWFLKKAIRSGKLTRVIKEGMETLGPIIWDTMKDKVLESLTMKLKMTGLSALGVKAKSSKKEARETAHDTWRTLSPIVGPIIVDNKLPGHDNMMIAKMVAPRIAGKEMEYLQKMMNQDGIDMPEGVAEMLNSLVDLPDNG